MTKTKSVRWRKHTKQAQRPTWSSSNASASHCWCSTSWSTPPRPGFGYVHPFVVFLLYYIQWFTVELWQPVHAIQPPSNPFFLFWDPFYIQQRSPRYRTSTNCTIATSVKTSTSLLKLRWMKMIQTDTQSCYTMVVPKGCMACYQKSSKVTLLTVPSTSCLHHPVDPVYKIEMKVLR